MNQIEFGRPMIGDEEKKAVLQVLDSPQLVHGPIAKLFEERFTDFIGGGYSTSTSSATTALQLAYMVLGIGPGDEVIVTSFTHIATANSIRAVGATPVFVDVELDTGNISIESIRGAITSKTRAICIVHYLGIPVNMDGILALAKSHKFAVVEDCALALGSTFKGVHVGLLGDFGAFSFYPAKHITTGEGGMLVSQNSSYIEEAMKIKAFYYSKGVGARKIPGQYDIVGFGLNLRMSEIAAAIGVEQLRKIREFLDAREDNAGILTQGFVSQKGSFISHNSPFGKSSYYCVAFILNSDYHKYREQLILNLKSLSIGTSIYYPISLPDSQFYRTNPEISRKISSENAAFLASANIAFGIGPHLTTSQLSYVRDSFTEIIEALK